ncbi:MAG: DUF664 domain-containing protein [candidate division Zixibacteria bacterium]|nr:DUF664 domain-containing protein [candidate division Zixibacteria bacterium]
MKSLLSPDDGFSPRIRKYFSLMEDVRRRTIEYVQSLNAEQLSWYPNTKIESIGTLLLHIAAVEISYIQEDIMKRPMGEEWKIAFPIRFNIPQITGKELSYFTDKLDGIRAESRRILWGYSDSDLDMTITPLEPAPGNEDVSYSLEWILYHLIEHEAHHRGQIALMKRLLPY